MTRENKDPSLESSSFAANVKELPSVDTNIVNMTAETLNFWLTKLVQEFRKVNGDRYPPPYAV